MGAGRPKKTFEEAKQDMPKDWFDEILFEYSDGAADVEIKAMFYKWLGSMSNDLWERWMEEEPEFSETIKHGRVLSANWWHKQGRKNLDNKEFSYTGWYMNMKNRFGWTDRVDNTTKGEKTAPIIVNLGEGRKPDEG